MMIILWVTELSHVKCLHPFAQKLAVHHNASASYNDVLSIMSRSMDKSPLSQQTRPESFQPKVVSLYEELFGVAVAYLLYNILELTYLR